MMVAHTFLPQSRGGMENHINHLRQHLRSRGHEVGVLYRIHAPDRPEFTLIEEQWEDAPVWKVVHNFSNPMPTLHPYYSRPIEERFAQVIEDFAPTLIHFHHLGGGLSTTLPSVARRRGIPTLWTLHDFWPMCFLSSLLTPDGRLCPGPDQGIRCAECLWLLHRRAPASSLLRQRTQGMAPWQVVKSLPWVLWDTFVALVLRNSQLPLRQEMIALTARDEHLRRVLMVPDLLISPSKFLVDTFVEWGIPASRFRHLPNSVAPALLGHRRPPDTAPHVRLSVGFIGRLYPYKGAHLLAGAFRQIDPAQARLRIWGDPPVPDDEGYYHALKHDVEGAPHISLEGGFPPDQLAQVLGQIDVLVVPSTWYENNPLVILEAFAMGIPVIAGDVGGMAELVEHEKNGLLFRTGDREDLAAKLRLLIEQPERLSHYRAHIRAPWSQAEMGAAVERIYDELSQCRSS